MKDLETINQEIKQLEAKRNVVLSIAREDIKSAVIAYSEATGKSINSVIKEIFDIVSSNSKFSAYKYTPCYYDPIVGKLEYGVGGGAWQFRKNLWNSGGKDEDFMAYLNKDHPKFEDEKWRNTKLAVLRNIYSRHGTSITVRVG